MVVEMHVIIAQRQLTRLIVGRQDRPGDPVGQIIRQRDRHGDDHDGDDDELRLQRGHRRLHRRKPRIDEDDILVAIRGIDDRGAGHIADLRVVAILIIDDDGGLPVLGRERLQIKLFIAVQHQRLARGFPIEHSPPQLCIHPSVHSRRFRRHDLCGVGFQKVPSTSG